MGFRFRKSVKIAPGVRLNLGKKSAGISIGNKYGGVNLNTKTGASTRVSAPGTGMSYTQKIGRSRKRSSNPLHDESTDSNTSAPKKPFYKRPWFIVLIVLLAIGAIWNLVSPENTSKTTTTPPASETVIPSTPTVLPSEEPGITESDIVSSLTSLVPAENITVRTSMNTTEITIFSPDIEQAESREALRAALTDLAPSLPLLPDTTGSIIYLSQTKGGEILYTFVNGILLYDAFAVQESAAPEAQDQPSEAMVYVSSTGSKYHHNPNCSGMNSPQRVTISQAINMGLEPCKKCS